MLDLVADVSDASSLDEYATLATRGLFDAVPCDIASYNEMDPVRGRALTVAVPEESMWAEAEEILARHVHDLRAVDVYQLHDLRAVGRIGLDLDEREVADDGALVRQVSPLG